MYLIRCVHLVGKIEEILDSSATISFSISTVLHGVSYLAPLHLSTFL